jgi:hypothetical protein
MIGASRAREAPRDPMLGSRACLSSEPRGRQGATARPGSAHIVADRP